MLLPISPLKNQITFGLSIWKITNIFFGQENYKVLTNITSGKYDTTSDKYGTTSDKYGTTSGTTSATTSDKYGTTSDKYGTTSDKYGTNGILQVYYPKGSSSPSKLPVGGFGFYSTPNEIYNARDVILEYSVMFDKSFNPVLGGKLPGLYISNGENTIGGSGGKHTNNTSCRIAWRADFNAEAYVYLPKTINQSETYYNNSIQNHLYGDSVWRGQLNFKKEIWNDVSLRIRLNTFNNKNDPNTDGLLMLTINNVTKQINDLVWTIDTTSRIQTIIFETFFGGSSPKAVTPNDTWSFFKNIKITKNG
jgi:hypothetical protein